MYWQRDAEKKAHEAEGRSGSMNDLEITEKVAKFCGLPRREKGYCFTFSSVLMPASPSIPISKVKSSDVSSNGISGAVGV